MWEKVVADFNAERPAGMEWEKRKLVGLWRRVRAKGHHVMME